MGAFTWLVTSKIIMKLTFAWEDVYKQSWQYSLAWYNTKKSDINYVNSIWAVCVAIISWNTSNSYYISFWFLRNLFFYHFRARFSNLSFHSILHMFKLIYSIPISSPYMWGILSEYPCLINCLIKSVNYSHISSLKLSKCSLYTDH